MADEAKASEPAGAVPRNLQALRAYLDGLLSRALMRPRLLGAEGVQLARGGQAYLAQLDGEGMQKLSDCLAAAEAPAAEAAADPCPECGAALGPGRYLVERNGSRWRWWNCPDCGHRELRPAPAAESAAGDAPARDRLVRCVDATLRRPCVWWGQDRTDMLNHRGYLMGLQGDDLRKLEAAQGEGD